MKYKLTKSLEILKKEKCGIKLDIYPDIEKSGIVRVKTKKGHNQEFYDKKSVFTYIILEGSGSFFLDDKEVKVEKGDVLSIEPKTRIYYKGELDMMEITTPPFHPGNEVETRASIW